MNNRENRNASFLFFLIFITASFDIFLNLKIAGFSFRIVLFLMGLSIALFFLSSLGKQKPVGKFLGLYPFIGWSLVNLLCLPHTTLLFRNIGYFGWLMVYALFILTTPFFINGEKSFLKLLKYYLYSYFLIGIFGIGQFAFGLFGRSVLTAQWLGERLPRINGFSYEPSYFATYMLLGWTVCLHFYLKKEFQVVSQKKLLMILFTLLIAIFLSTSRMGIMVMGITLIYFLWPILVRFVKRGKVPASNLGIIFFFISLLFLTPVLIIVYFDKLEFLFNGLGLFGMPAHSSLSRMSQFSDTLSVFWNSPFWGYSLGGIPSAIAQLRGAAIFTQEEAKEYEGMCVFAEILAAGGVFGAIFFCRYLYVFYKKIKAVIWRLTTVNPALSGMLKGLLISLTFELLILCFNQTILRPYVWIHIAILNAGYFIGMEQLKKSKEEG